MSRSFALRTVLLAGVVGTVAAFSAAAQGSPAQAPPRDSSRSLALDTVKVSGRIDNLVGIAASASEGRVGASELRVRPITREGELLESVPGLIVTQHSGEGKANQYFVRGFNLDHGTDFSTRIEGMPVNMATHAHGQGYSDLNFLVPELVEYLDYKLGVYHTELGDFGSAGGAEFHLVRRLDRPFAAVEYGQNGLGRFVAGRSDRVGDGNLVLGGEVKSYNSAFEKAEDLRKVSGVVRYSFDRGPSRFSVLGMAYRNRWNSNDQIPLRAVNSGSISRFGQIDSTDGGNTQRYSLSGSWRHLGEKSVQDVQLYGVYYDLSLFSDFTYFLDNPDRGDQFNQRDKRLVFGGSARHVQAVAALGVSHQLTLGLQSRYDDIKGLSLFRTRARVRELSVRQDDVRESGSGVFVEAESRWQPWFRTVFGVRGDAYTFDVRSDRPENSGTRVAGIVSPKASLVFTPWSGTELYLSGGFGFHSNDARGTTITVDPATGEKVEQVDPLVRSRGAELGVRAAPFPGERSTLSLWALDLDSELLFSGDGGTTAPSAASRRRGVTLANFYKPIPELSVDADVSFATARFSGVPTGQSHVPGALENVIAAGVSWNTPRRGPFGAVRVRHFGSYPLIEDNSVRAIASTVLSAEAGVFLPRGVRLQASLLNILNARADDIQYFYTSRLKGEPTTGVDDVHFHPLEPRQVRVSLGWGF